MTPFSRQCGLGGLFRYEFTKSQKKEMDFIVPTFAWKGISIHAQICHLFATYSLLHIGGKLVIIFTSRY